MCLLPDISLGFVSKSVVNPLSDKDNRPAVSGALPGNPPHSISPCSVMSEKTLAASCSMWIVAVVGAPGSTVPGPEFVDKSVAPNRSACDTFIHVRAQGTARYLHDRHRPGQWCAS